jgi:DNA-binding response OmpR family regulator
MANLHRPRSRASARHSSVAWLLCLAVRDGGKTVPRSKLEAAAWGLSDPVTPNALDVALHRIRRQTRAIASRQNIVNVRSLGYALREDDAAE